MRLLILVAFTLCLITANVQAVVKLNPDGKTYTVDPCGSKIDKKPDQMSNRDSQKTLPKPSTRKPDLSKKKK